MRLPWFSRVWTIQEAVLAQDPIIFCGNAAVPFDKLPLAPSFDWEISYKVKRITIFKCLRDFSKLNKGGGVKNTPDLAWIMDDISSRSVTEPKDKIFAIRDLLGDLGVALAPPDYGLSLGTIYWEATKVLLKEDIHILYLVNDSCSDLRASSWVPDYRDGDLPQHFEFRLATGHFSANSPAARKADCFFYSLSDDGQSLKLNGIALDSISQYSTSKIWHPGKAFPIARTKSSTMTSHALDIIRPLQEFALVVYEMGASKSDQIWQCSFLSAVLRPSFESPKWRNAEDWCEILLANRKEHNDAILPDSTQLPRTRVLDKYWSEMMRQKLWPWRDSTGMGFSWAASASEALANQ